MRPYFEDDAVSLYEGDALAVLRELSTASVDCCVTSPPYFGLRDYGVPVTSWPALEYVPMTGLPPVSVAAMSACLGLEPDPVAYVGHLLLVLREARRVLASDGTLWLNIGESYANKANAAASTTGGRAKVAALPGRINTTQFAPYKSQLGIPWRVAQALIADCWVLRNEIIWSKPNGTPESMTDRFTRRHEHLFFLTPAANYWFGGDPSQGDVWRHPIEQFPAAHFATMPTSLAEDCVSAGCRPAGTVLDPYSGSGTTGLAAGVHGCRYVGIDLNRDYLDLSLRTRLAQAPLLDGESA